MAKFCTECGAECVNGECPKGHNATSKTFTHKTDNLIDETQPKSSFSFQNIINVYKNILIRPITVIQAIIKKNSAGLTWVLLIISALISGICGYLISLASTGVKFNFGECLKAILSFGVADFIGYIALAFFAMVFIGLIFKGGGKFMEYLSTNAAASALLTVFSVIGTIVFFAFPLASFIIFIFAYITYIVLILQGYSQVVSTNSNTFAYGVALSVITSGLLLGGLLFFIYSSVLSINNSFYSDYYSPLYDNIFNDSDGTDYRRYYLDY